jgi:transposase
MFWAAFGYSKRTNIVTMKGDPDAPRGSVIAHRYIEIIERYLPTVLDINSIVMQDNSSLHTAYMTQRWFEERGNQVVDWLPYSPDMNPIENLWKILKAKVIELYPELIIMKDNNTTRDLLINAVEEAMGIDGRRALKQSSL